MQNNQEKVCSSLSKLIECYIVTGLSGAGKSTAVQVFEDLGYFTVEGLPVSLVPEMVRMMLHPSMQSFRGIVLGISLHNESLTEDVNSIVQKLCVHGIHLHCIFLEASETELLRRYATTRRPHPLEQSGIGLADALLLERENLARLRQMADMVLDTTEYSMHDLRRTLQKLYAYQGKSQSRVFLRPLKVHVISFGFKYGVPKEADMIFDVRFLPNPHFDKELRPFNGQDKRIDEYVYKGNLEQVFFQKLADFLLFVLGLMEAEGRYRVTLAVGCTGGKHRSVATVERLYKAIMQAGYAVSSEHRHMALDNSQK